MQIGDRFDQGQTEACSPWTARRIDPVEPIAYVGEMLWRNSTASVFDRQFGTIRFVLRSDSNFAAVRSEAEGVIEEITQSAIEQQRVGTDVAVTFVGNGNTSLFCDCPIIGRDLFNRGPRGKDASFDLAINSFGAREK